MDLTELLRVLWRRKVVAAAAFVVVVACGIASLLVQTPVYRATSTIALVPDEQSQEPIFIISQIDVITPLYAEAIKTRTTRDEARDDLGDVPLGAVDVRTFRGAPIIKIDVESTNPRYARLGAQAVTDALLARVRADEIGIPGTLRVNQIDRPTEPEEPVRPMPKLTILISVVLGLGAALATAVLRERFAGRVETVEELTAVAGVPSFGQIPSSRHMPGITSPAALVSDARHRVLAEALRDVRTNLQFTEANFRSVLITSPEGRHGKTTIAMGLAATVAKAGARTLLIDGDLRRGRVAEMLGLERTPGLMEVLAGLPADRAVQKSDLDNLFVLTGGSLADDPGELLEAAFFRALYEVEAQYDVVVVDGPPLVPVNDARLIARYTSTTLLVVSAGASTRRQVRVASDRLSIIGAPITATVLNNSRERRRASYYRYLTTEEAG